MGENTPPPSARPHQGDSVEAGTHGIHLGKYGQYSSVGARESRCRTVMGNKIGKKGRWRVFVAKLMTCIYYFRLQESLKVLSKEVTQFVMNKQ